MCFHPCSRSARTKLKKVKPYTHKSLWSRSNSEVVAGIPVKRDGCPGGDLSGADLRGAILNSANLSGTNLQGEKLQKAELKGANLRDANLQDANLMGTELDGAVIEGENLEGTDLQQANLQDAKLNKVKCRGDNDLEFFSKLTNSDLAILVEVLIKDVKDRKLRWTETLTQDEVYKKM